NEHMVQQELQSKLPLRESVLNLAQLTHDAGLDGVVSSPLESQMLHEKIGPDFLTITPGIRLKENQTDDQVRIVPPDEARELGSNYRVVGRAITQSDSSVDSYHKIKTIRELK